MITMDKKYRHDGDDGAVLSVTASNPWCVVWQAARSGEIYRFTKNGHGSVMDLIEVVPDVVSYHYVSRDGLPSPACWTLNCLRLNHCREDRIAIVKTTVRNGSDVSVETLPAGYQEPTP